MKRTRALKGIVVAVVAAFMVLAIAGCSKDVTVTIKQANNAEVQVSVKSGTTVEDALKQANVAIDEDDETVPERTTKIESDLVVNVAIVTYTDETVTEAIPFTSRTEYDDSALEGTSWVQQEGVDGERTVVYRTKFVDGVDMGRSEASSTVTREPVEEVVMVGTKEPSYSSAAPQSNGRTVVNRVPVPNCDDPNHGYYEVYYSDGSVEYVEY